MPTQQQTNQIQRHGNLSLLFGGLAIIAGIAGAAFTGGTSLGLAAMGVSMAAGAYSSYETIRTGQVMKQAGISGGKTQQILGGVGIALSALPGVGAVLGTGARIAGASAAGASMISRAANTVATGVGAGMAGYGAVMTTKSIVDLASGKTQGTWQDYVGIIEGVAGIGVGAATAYRGNGNRGSFTGLEEPLLQARPGVAETLEPPMLNAQPGVKPAGIRKQTITVNEQTPANWTPEEARQSVARTPRLGEGEYSTSRTPKDPSQVGNDPTLMGRKRTRTIKFAADVGVGVQEATTTPLRDPLFLREGNTGVDSFDPIPTTRNSEGKPLYQGRSYWGVNETENVSVGRQRAQSFREEAEIKQIQRQNIDAYKYRGSTWTNQELATGAETQSEAQAMLRSQSFSVWPF